MEITIKTSDGVNVDNFEEIKEVVDALRDSLHLGKADSASGSLQAKNGEDVVKVAQNFENRPVADKPLVDDRVLCTLRQVESSVWAGQAYVSGNKVSEAVMGSMNVILGKLGDFIRKSGQDKNDKENEGGVRIVDVGCNSTSIGEILYVLEGMARYMGVYSDSLAGCIYNLTEQLRA